LRDLECGIEIIKARWARDEPKPVRGTIPLLIGGGGEKVTLRIAAQHADLWHGFGSPEVWGRKNRILDDWCARVGRSPVAIERSAFIADEFSQAPIKDMRRHYDTLEAYVAAGANHIYYGLGTPFDLSPIVSLLEWRDQRAGQDQVW
jgi:alkanesulfonate monooxygenase SsuD/methylene tetrahydromethanopterin reductase-like flavin-dependent oxidoreductase (luciferase family)